MKRTISNAAAAVLPKSMKDSLFGLGFNLAPERFQEFAFRYAHAPHMAHGMSALSERGYRPDLVVDIGSYHGDWARTARRVWPGASIVMVEGNTEKEEMLTSVASEIGAALHIALLGAEEGREVEFNVMESGSSVLAERSPLERQVVTRTLRTLDGVMAGTEWSGEAFLKLDAQGYELEILRGAGATLPKVSGLLLEVSLIEINEGAPLLADVTAFMAEQGFAACEIMEVHRRPLDAAMNQIDVFFVPTSSPLFADKRHF